MPKKKVRLPNGKHAFDMTTILDIQRLTQVDAMLKKQFEGSRAQELMREIRNLEDHALECVVENLQKEVDQVANAASRLQEIAAHEDSEAQQKREKVRNCLEQIIKEYGDCLSDPDSFANDYHNKLDEIGDTLSAEAGPAGCLLDPAEMKECYDEEADENLSALAQLNKATRRKLLVQVELDRIDEELRMEIEKNAMSEPASHPVTDGDVDVDESDVTSSEDISTM